VEEVSVDDGGAEELRAALAGIAAARIALVMAESALVRQAREAGWPWEAIGEAMGLPYSTVYRRHRRVHERRGYWPRLADAG
jgi:hypothetical protein